MSGDRLSWFGEDGGPTYRKNVARFPIRLAPAEEEHAPRNASRSLILVSALVNVDARLDGNEGHVLVRDDV